MGREHRPQIAGGIHHVYARGNRRELIFRYEDDFDRFLFKLSDEVARCKWNLFAYSLIPNHYHLLFETPEPNLSDGMQRLNLRWAKAFNREHDTVGHVFQGRFGLNVVGDDIHFEEALRYVIRNPVRAGLCAAARDWYWGSYAELMGTAPPRWLVNLERLGELVGCSVAELPARITRRIS